MPPLPIFIGAAIIDSINPCAFGVLIFLLTYLLKNSKNKTKLLINGLSYVAAVFATYLIAGIILMPIIGSLGKASVAGYAILGSLTIIAGLLEIKDFFWYGKGPTLELLPGAATRIKMYSKLIGKSIFSSFLLGVFVALVELPCTGAVYLAILASLALAGYSTINVSLLIIYNLIFVAPLIIILLLFYLGISGKSVESWRQRHKKTMRLLIGTLLLALGFWMLKTALF